MNLSEVNSDLFKALASFRKKITQPNKDGTNPTFRRGAGYVTLDNMINAIDKVVPELGLSYVQNLKSEGEYMVGVQTIIMHSSGGYIEFDFIYIDARPIIKGGNKGQATSQSIGSAITYGRRYSLGAAFGIASDFDDDGNESTGNHKQQQNHQQPKMTQQQNFLNDKANELYEEHSLSRGDFYNKLKVVMNVTEPVNEKLSDLVMGAKKVKQGLQQQGNQNEGTVNW